jgi:hypothetical protein
MNPDWHLAVPFSAPFVKAIGRYEATLLLHQALKARLLGYGFSAGIDHAMSLMTDQVPKMEPGPTSSVSVR